MPETHAGTCYCGAVAIQVTGMPLQIGYCHCHNCRRYSGTPVAAFTLWKRESVAVTRGKELLGRYKSSEDERAPVLHRMRWSRHGRAFDAWAC